jgi:hypothetical protein
VYSTSTVTCSSASLARSSPSAAAKWTFQRKAETHKPRLSDYLAARLALHSEFIGGRYWDAAPQRRVIVE